MIEYNTELALAPAGVFENSHALRPITKDFTARSLSYPDIRIIELKSLNCLGMLIQMRY
jgi:hypothetical protein